MRVWAKEILAMPPPREVDQAKVYYHGTPRTDSALGILHEGIIPNTDNRWDSEITCPLPNCVYVTSSLQEAIHYANEMITAEPYGYVFVIPGSQLTQDIVVDEDKLLELLRLLQLNGESSDYVLTKAWPVWLPQMPLSSLSWLYQLAATQLGPGSWGLTGAKRLLSMLTADQTFSLIDLGVPALAHAGRLQPSEAWRFEKRYGPNGFMNYSGTNFFTLAERWEGEDWEET